MEEQQQFWVNWMVRRDNIRYKFGLPVIDVSQNFFCISRGVDCFDIYSVTNVTMWSLNVPLITWWRRSGDKSSWIFACRNPYVKGCGYKFNSKFRKNKEMHHYIRNYSIVIPKRVFLTTSKSASVCRWAHCPASPWSRSFQSASHLKTWGIKIRFHHTINHLYRGHHPCTIQASRTCSG